MLESISSAVATALRASDRRAVLKNGPQGRGYDLAPRARFLSGRPLLAARLLCGGRLAIEAFRQVAHRRLAELPRRAPRPFFSAMAVVAEQARHGIAPAKKVHLKTVRLFLGARFRVDAPNVLFRIRISSFFHVLHSRSHRADCKRVNDRFFMMPAAANASPAVSCRTRPAARARSKDAAPHAST